MSVFLYAILILNWKSASAQSLPREVQVCTQYKKQLFEKEYSYAAFVRDAPAMKSVVDNCKRYDPFIVGGLPAKPKEFPSMARVGHQRNGKTFWFCGGTLISERYVLTAAHCFYMQNAAVNQVRLGELDFSNHQVEANPEDFGVKRWIKHPDYIFSVPESPLYNDIGLIELDRSVTFDSFKHPACLPVNSDTEFYELIATGWGSTHAAGPPSPQLLKVKLNRYNDFDCKTYTALVREEILPSGLNESSQMCAGSSFERDTCGGDSGGPLFTYHTQYPCMYIVVGITSAGIEDCGKLNVPGIYTRVYYFMDWIKSYVFSNA